MFESLPVKEGGSPLHFESMKIRYLVFFSYGGACLCVIYKCCVLDWFVSE